MAVLEMLDTLQARYFAAKGARSVLDIMGEVGVSRHTLARYARGGYVSVSVLLAIEEWVVAQEGKPSERHAAPRRGLRAKPPTP